MPQSPIVGGMSDQLREEGHEHHDEISDGGIPGQVEACAKRHGHEKAGSGGVDDRDVGQERHAAAQTATDDQVDRGSKRASKGQDITQQGIALVGELCEAETQSSVNHRHHVRHADQNAAEHGQGDTCLQRRRQLLLEEKGRGKTDPEGRGGHQHRRTGNRGVRRARLSRWRSAAPA